VWVADREGKVQFFGEKEVNTSEIAPDFPDEI